MDGVSKRTSARARASWLLMVHACHSGSATHSGRVSRSAGTDPPPQPGSMELRRGLNSPANATHKMGLEWTPSQRTNDIIAAWAEASVNGFAQKNQLARSPHRKKMATELAPSAQKKFRPQKKQLARSESLKRAS